MSRMPRSVVDGVKELLSTRFSELARLDVSWFGGEPLLASDIVLEVLEHIQGLRETHPETAFSSDVTTNAYRLDTRLLERLVSLGVESFQITLDGTSKQHDLKRKRADGAGTFDAIWANLLAMKASETPFAAILRLHVDQTNQDDMASLLDQCAGAFRGDPRFSFFIRPLSRFGGPHDASLRVLAPREADQVIGELRSRARGLGLQVWEKPDQETLCYAARPNSLVVRANGLLNKCTVALQDQRNAVGALRSDGTLSLNKNAMLPWIRGLWNGNPEDLKCPLVGLPTSANSPQTPHTEKPALSRS